MKTEGTLPRLRFSVIVICVVFEALCFHEQKSVAFTSALPKFVRIDSRNKKKQT